MKLTTNYSLKKPDLTDKVNINDFNSNVDKIDNEIKKVNNSLTNTNTKIENTISDTALRFNDIENNKVSKLELDVERKRIDTLMTLPEGGTISDANLIESKIGINGESYSTLGNAVREQVKELYNSIYELKKMPFNFFSGGINNTGNDSTTTSVMNTHCRTRHMILKKGDIIKTGNYLVTIYNFRGDLAFLNLEDYKENTTIKITEDKIVRIRIRKSDESNINTNSAVGSIINNTEMGEIFKSFNIYHRNKLETINNGKYIGGFRQGRIIEKRLDWVNNTVFSQVIKLKKGNQIYINSGFNFNLLKYSENEITGILTFVRNGLINVENDGEYILYIQKETVSQITENDIKDIKIMILESVFNNKFIQGKTSLIYHRGFSALRPENTIPAFGMVKEYGGEWVEMDVQMTSDNELIVFHDNSVDRLTESTGNIKDMTLSQIKDLYIYNSFFTGLYNKTLKIPTFEETLKFCKTSGLKIVVELKDNLDYNKLITLIKKYGFENECIIISGSYDRLLEVRKLNDKINLCLLIEKYTSDQFYSFTKLGINSGIGFNLNTVTSELVDKIHNAGGFVITFVTDNFNELKGLKDVGSDYVMTNRLLDGNNLNYVCKNLYTSTSGTTVDFTIPSSQIELFGDVIEVSCQVRSDSLIDPPIITIGDLSYKIPYVNEWNFVNLQFIQRKSGDVKITLTGVGEYILFDIRQFIRRKV